jgi:hypothetical protein
MLPPNDEAADRLDGQHRLVVALDALALGYVVSDVGKRCNHADQRREDHNFDIHNQPASFLPALLMTLAVNPVTQEAFQVGKEHCRGKERVRPACVFMALRALDR